MVLKLAMSLFALVVVVPWIAVTWLFGNSFLLIGIAEILEDGDALGRAMFNKGTSLALVGLFVLVLNRARGAYRRTRRAHELTLAAASEDEDAEETAWLNRPSLWARWGPSMGSVVFAFLLFVFLLVGAALLDNPTDFPTLGIKLVGLLLLLFFMGMIWVPWKALNWSWSAASALHRFGMATMWRNGLLTGLLATGVLTLNPAVLPVSLGVGSMIALDALGSDELAQSESRGDARSILVPVQARAPRVPGAQSNGPDSLREVFVEIAREIEWGNEPGRATTPAAPRPATTTSNATADCFNALYSNRNAQGSTEFQLAMRRVHRRSIGHPDDEDIVYGAMTRVCERHGSVQRIQEFGPYFNRAVRNAIVDHHSRTAQFFPLPDEQDDYTYNNITRTDRAEAISLRTAIAQLRPQEKTAIELLIQGYTYPQIADELNISETNARQVVSRARRRLR